MVSVLGATKLKDIIGPASAATNTATATVAAIDIGMVNIAALSSLRKRASSAKKRGMGGGGSRRSASSMRHTRYGKSVGGGGENLRGWEGRRVV